MRLILNGLCWFTAAASAWLAVMFVVLRHPAFERGFGMSLLFVLQSLLALAVVNGVLSAWTWRVATLAGAIGIIWAGGAALADTLTGPHFEGFALVIGTAAGLIVSRSKVLRAGVGSMITGLQTMPSIAWFPAAIVIFGLGESAILFVIVLGAAPSIANGLISGVDNIPPVLLRAGRVLGARGLSSVRHVVLPAALPSFIGGLKQGWAFAWRSLLAGDLIVLIAGKVSLGQELQGARDLNNYRQMYSVMMMIFIIGVVVDAVIFGTAERWIRRRYGLIDATES